MNETIVFDPKYHDYLTPKQSEAEVVAFVYQRLRDYGHIAHLEVRSKCSGCRFDIVVYDANRHPIRIIEIKRKRKHPIAKQLDRYLLHGIPVDVVSGFSRALKYVERWKDGVVPPAHHMPKQFMKHLRYMGASQPRRVEHGSPTEEDINRIRLKLRR